MKTNRHILSPISQTEVRACETADQSVVGLAQDYPSGLFADFHSHPADNRCLSEWSEMVGASERTLARLFRSETGLSFRQWRQQARLTAAMSSLSNGCSPVKAASIAGFDSQSAFGVAFRKFFGITPGKARTLNLVSAEQAAFQLRSHYRLPPPDAAI